MRKLIPPLALFLIGIGYWYYDRFSTDISAGTESSKDTSTDDKPLPKKSVEKKDSVDKPLPKKSDENKGTVNKPLAKKNVESKDTEDMKILDDRFPLRYLTDWKTDEGPMILMQGPEKKIVKGIYYHEDTLDQRGRIATTYIQKNNMKILSGYWIQTKSMKKCDFEKYGSYYWGRLAFEFKGDSFIGIWGYCDDKPNANWNGRRV